MSEFAVELRDVVKTFATPEGGKLNAVDHVDMHIRQGEFFIVAKDPGNRYNSPPQTLRHGFVIGISGIDQE